MKKIIIFIENNQGKILAGMIFLYALFFSIISIWKYGQLLYNGMDLGIINNVFYNIVNGNGTWSSVQGHNYFGDHFTPILFLLAPIYMLWQSPVNLLIIQSVALGMAAWPIYAIAKLKIKSINPLLISLLWLINPLVHNVNLFEWHFISLLPLLFFTTFCLYLRLKESPKNKILLCCFITSLLFTLMIREDVAFILLIFLAIALIENRKNRFILLVTSYQLLVTIIWAIFAQIIISHFSSSGATPFVYYYGWLNGAYLYNIIVHIFSYKNLEMLVGFLLPFLFIPIMQRKWLWISAVPVAQIIFTRAGGGALIWQLHYAALFLPALVLAFIYSFESANNWFARKLGSKYLLIIFLVVVNVYLVFQIGPFPATKEQKNLDTNTLWEQINAVSVGDAVIAGNKYLAPLSSRSEIYAFNYAYLGTQQFGSGEYVIGDKPDVVLIDKSDALELYAHIQYLGWANTYFKQGENNWSQYDGVVLNNILNDLGDKKQAQGGLEIDKLGSLKLVIDN